MHNSKQNITDPIATWLTLQTLSALQDLNEKTLSSQSLALLLHPLHTHRISICDHGKPLLQTLTVHGLSS